MYEGSGSVKGSFGGVKEKGVLAKNMVYLANGGPFARLPLKQKMP